MAKNLDVKVNANFIPPPTIGSNPVVGTKCPYRKIYHAYSDDWATTLKNATEIVEDFQDCLGKDCACWTPIGCGRR